MKLLQYIKKKREGGRKLEFMLYTKSNMPSLVIDLEWKVRTKNNFKTKTNEQTYKYTGHTSEKNTCFILVALHPLILG